MKRIIIENLKDIKKMVFDIPEKNGVYLIAGSNGCGKTTLLVCLDRICNGIAFATGFTKTSSWVAADQYTDSEIKYIVDSQQVCYKKTLSRWAPTPRTSYKTLNKFGFSDSIFIKADSNRIDVKQEDLTAGNLTTVDREVKDALNKIFETGKYEKLQRVKNTHGRGRGAVYFYVLREGNGQNAQYYSEKRFSTGELAMVRLVERIETVTNGSMILLDEAELALHPRVQVKLVEYLKEKAEQKNLWVFISTHSPTMLKNANRDEIILLKKEESETKVVTSCYPAQAIGEVDFADSNIFDYIFFVEDDKAVEILKHLLKRYFGIIKMVSYPIYIIIPVGGFYETARLAVYTNRRVFGKSLVRAVVDQDAFEDSEDKPKFEELYKTHKNIIKTLSFTPEEWLIDKIEKADAEFKQQFLNEFNIELSMITNDSNYLKCNSPKSRKLAKAKYNVVLDILSDVSCRAREVEDSELINMIIESLSEAEIMGIVKPIIKKNPADE